MCAIKSDIYNRQRCSRHRDFRRRTGLLELVSNTIVLDPLFSKFRIRPAEVEDSTFLARAILNSSRSHLPDGLWDLVVSGSEEDRLDFLELLTLMEIQTFCHYSNFLVADGNDGTAAALAGFDPGDPSMVAPGHAIAAAFEELGASDTEIADAFRRLETYQTGMPEQKNGLWTIEWVWTVASMQRQGIASALIERILGEGRRRGLRRAQITTFSSNTAAILAYEKAGFRIAEEKRHPDFERLMGAPGMVRYERGL